MGMAEFSQIASKKSGGFPNRCVKVQHVNTWVAPLVDPRERRDIRCLQKGRLMANSHQGTFV